MYRQRPLNGLLLRKLGVLLAFRMAALPTALRFQRLQGPRPLYGPQTCRSRCNGRCMLCRPIRQCSPSICFIERCCCLSGNGGAAARLKRCGDCAVAADAAASRGWPRAAVLDCFQLRARSAKIQRLIFSGVNAASAASAHVERTLAPAWRAAVQKCVFCATTS